MSQAMAQGGGGDTDVLNFALTLEYLEAAFYDQAVKIKDAGGKPVTAPGVDFGGSFASQASFLKIAQTFEDLGVSAYNGAAPQIKSKDVLGAAGAIVQVEARHAAAIRFLRGKPITDAAFDKPLGMAGVLEAAKPFIRS